MTAVIISVIPMAISVVKTSWKQIIPTTMAVTGSIAPSTDVTVEPMRFTACIRAKLDKVVGISASKNKEATAL